MMSKKDYVRFAIMFSEELSDLHELDEEESMAGVLLARIIRNTTKIFSEDNPMFDSEKFYSALEGK